MPKLSATKGWASSRLGCGWCNHWMSKHFVAREADTILNICCKKTGGCLWVSKAIHVELLVAAGIMPGSNLLRWSAPWSVPGSAIPMGLLWATNQVQSLLGPSWGGTSLQLIFSGVLEHLANSVMSPTCLISLFFLLFLFHGQFHSMKFAELKKYWKKKKPPSLQGNLNSKKSLDIMMFAGLLCSFFPCAFQHSSLLCETTHGKWISGNSSLWTV